jgi:flavodoxin
MSVAIVYYSKDNNTRTGAKLLQKKVGGDIIELIEKKKGNFLQSLLKKGSKLKDEPWKAIEGASVIYLMSPIWASNGVPAMNTFLEKADLKGKECIIITFQQFEDLKNSSKVHAHYETLVKKRSGKVLESYAFKGGKMGHFAGNEAIKDSMDILLKS